MKSHYLLFAVVPLLLVSCSGEETGPPVQSAKIPTEQTVAATQQVSATPEPVARWYDFGLVSLGAKLFSENCAACHGQAAVGASGWQTRGADGQYPAPPLNSSAHTWHHPFAMLLLKIKNGGQGTAMPAWSGRLKDDEIKAIIAWFQSRWPDEIYTEWSRRDQAFRKQNGLNK